MYGWVWLPDTPGTVYVWVGVATRYTRYCVCMGGCGYQIHQVMCMYGWVWLPDTPGTVYVWVGVATRYTRYCGWLLMWLMSVCVTASVQVQAKGVCDGAFQCQTEKKMLCMLCSLGRPLFRQLEAGGGGGLAQQGRKEKVYTAVMNLQRHTLAKYDMGKLYYQIRCIDDVNLHVYKPVLNQLSHKRVRISMLLHTLFSLHLSLFRVRQFRCCVWRGCPCCSRQWPPATPDICPPSWPSSTLSWGRRWTETRGSTSSSNTSRFSERGRQ